MRSRHRRGRAVARAITTVVAVVLIVGGFALASLTIVAPQASSRRTARR